MVPFAFAGAEDAAPLDVASSRAWAAICAAVALAVTFAIAASTVCPWQVAGLALAAPTPNTSSRSKPAADAAAVNAAQMAVTSSTA